MYNWTEERLNDELGEKLTDVGGDPTPILGGDLDLDSNAFVATLVAGASLAVGDLCYRRVDNRMVKADASQDHTANSMLGIATEVMDEGQAGKFCIKGFFASTGHASGDLLYMSTTPGTWSRWTPIASGQIVRIIGYGITESEIFFDPDRTWIELG